MVQLLRSSHFVDGKTKHIRMNLLYILKIVLNQGTVCGWLAMSTGKRSGGIRSKAFRIDSKGHDSNLFLDGHFDRCIGVGCSLQLCRVRVCFVYRQQFPMLYTNFYTKLLKSSFERAERQPLLSYEDRKEKPVGHGQLIPHGMNPSVNSQEVGSVHTVNSRELTVWKKSQTTMRRDR